MIQKTFVDVLHEYNTPDHKGQNGWSAEAWNKIIKEFHKREPYTGFTTTQTKVKEKELKRDYRTLKDARKQSGVSWDAKRCMIVADPPIWNNIGDLFPRAKKFRNKPFPLFESLEELHDGQYSSPCYTVHA